MGPSRSLWRLLVEEQGWLPSLVLSFLERGGDDLHFLYLLATEEELHGFRALLTRQSGVCVAHVRNLAMARSWWTALTKIPSDVSTQRVGNRRSREKTVDRIIQELDRLQVPTHSHRRLGLLQIAESCERPSPGARLRGARRLHVSTAMADGPQPFVMYAAARMGNLESVVWLHHVTKYDHDKALEEAARHNHAGVVSWLLANPTRGTSVTVDSQEHDLPDFGGLMAWRANGLFHTMSRTWGYKKTFTRYGADTLAAESGDCQAIEWLLAPGPLFDYRIVQAAASAGQLAVLELLHRRCSHVFDKSNALYCAAAGGQLEVVQWLVASTTCNKYDDSTVISVATEHGHVRVLQWIKDTSQGRARLYPTSTWHSQRYTDPALLAWLIREVDFKVTIENAKAAISNADTELAKWVVARCQDRSAWAQAESNSFLEKAIACGNLELVRWCVEDHHVWIENAFVLASRGPSVDVLEYVYEKARARSSLGVPVTREYLIPGSLRTFVWLLDHGYRDALLASEHSLDLIKAVQDDYTRRHRQLDPYEPGKCPRFYQRGSRRYPFASLDLHLLHRVLVLIIKLYDPSLVRRVGWLPAWAVEHHRVDCLERLAEIGHPSVFRQKLFNRVLIESDDEAIVRWYIEHKLELFTPRVVQWGVKRRKNSFLAWVFQVYLPTYQANQETTQRLRDCVRTTIWTGAKRGCDDVLRALPGWTAVASDPTLWHGVHAL